MPAGRTAKLMVDESFCKVPVKIKASAKVRIIRGVCEGLKKLKTFQKKQFVCAKFYFWNDLRTNLVLVILN